MALRFATTVMLACLCGAPLAAQNWRRASVWDIKIGQPISAQPTPEAFRAFACGSNGGPPRRPLAGWQDFASCPADPMGLHEVYFEYDDEYEYIARAKDLAHEIAQFAGTTEAAFPVIVSALFDARGVVKGIRVVTDTRADHRNETTDDRRRRRPEAYLFGRFMAARFDVEPARDCRALPAAPGESPVGTVFVKQVCERTDTALGRRFVVQANHYRKPGQSGVNPQQPTQLTRGQFESSARLEVWDLSP